MPRPRTAPITTGIVRSHRRTPSSAPARPAVGRLPCAPGAPDVVRAAPYELHRRLVPDQEPLGRLDGRQLAQPPEAEREQAADARRVRAWPSGVPYGSTKSRLKMDRPRTKAIETADDDLHRPAGRRPLRHDALAHVDFLARRLGERAQHLAQTRAAQPGVEDEGGDDDVGGGVVDLVGELLERLGERGAGAQPVDERVQVRAQDGRRGACRRGDGLFQADRAGDGVAQRLRPGGERLDAPHAGASPRRRRRRAVPEEDEDAGRDAGHRPAGEQQYDEADDGAERAALAGEPDQLARALARPSASRGRA